MKKFLCFVLCIIALLGIVGCTSDKQGDVSSNVQVVENEQSSSDVSDVEAPSVVDDSKIIVEKDDVSADSECVSFIFYTDIDNNVYRKKVGLQSDKEIVLALRVLEEIGVTNAGIKSIVKDTDSNSILIDFKSDASVLQSGTAGENQILQSLALTFILGDDVESVYYNVNGEVYASGHYYFEPDGFYISKNILLNNWDELFPKVVTQ